MNPMEFAEIDRSRSGLLPVIVLATERDLGAIAQSLRERFVGFVPREQLTEHFVPAIEQICTLPPPASGPDRIYQWLTHIDGVFCLENDPALIPALVSHLQQQLVSMNCQDEVSSLQIGVALSEALSNALYHGNLEVSSALRQHGDKEFQRMAEQRRSKAPYKDRKIHLRYSITPQQSVWVVRDEGPGFTLASLPDATDPQGRERLHGRGILLMQGLMDEVTFNPVGNEVTLLKRKTS
ncbi:MAG: ATP-binding protein [Terriglobia bacterium]